MVLFWDCIHVQNTSQIYFWISSPCPPLHHPSHD
jgi:hypothetical protein